MDHLTNLTESLLRHDEHDHDHHDHAHEDEDTSAVMIAKAVAMVSLFVLSMIFGMVPMTLNSFLRPKPNDNKNTKGKTCSKKHHEDSLEDGAQSATSDTAISTEAESFKKPRIVKLLLNFGGGVLMATTFLHLLPEVKENVESLQGEGRLPHLGFQLAELLMCFGFFLMFLIDESVHVYIHRRERINAVSPATGASASGHDAGEDEKLEEIFHRNLSFRKRDFEKNFSSPKKYSGGRNNSISQTNLISTKSDENLNDNCREIYVVPGQNDVKPVDANLSKKESGAHKQTKSLVKKEDTLVKNIRGLLIVLALSVHELFEGLAVGLEPSPSNVYYMFGAISAHKLVIAFCIGIELVTSELKTKLIIAYITTFAVVSPLGIGLGMVLSRSAANGIPNAILQGIACGTLLYVVFFEILLPSVQSKHEHSHFGDATYPHDNHEAGSPEIRAPAYDYSVAPPPHYTSNGSSASPSTAPEAEKKQEFYKPLEESSANAANSTPITANEDEIRRRSETSARSITVDRTVAVRDSQKEQRQRKPKGALSDFGGLLQYFAVLVGFLVMFGLQFLTGHEHSHGGGGHDHGHSHGEEHSHLHS